MVLYDEDVCSASQPFFCRIFLLSLNTGKERIADCLSRVLLRCKKKGYKQFLAMHGECFAFGFATIN